MEVALQTDDVGMLVAMLATEFDRVRVMDPELRRKLVRRMLDEEDFLGEALGKYELDELLRGHDDYTEVILEEQVRTIRLEMHLSADEQALLSRHNRDVRLLFEPGVVMDHAYYFAQRIIDTDRCLRVLAHYGGEIIDIGGNYTAHARQCRIVHSCTLLDSAREAHRQTEREVRMIAENICLDEVDRCVGGTINCNRQATQSMSVHAMTAISWGDWPEIMDRHNTAYHVGVFHYDPVMLVTKHGKLDGGFMYYEIEGDEVVFHFEGDSSLDYTHSWSNFQKYTSPWCQYSKKSPWAYLYDLKSLQGGIATVEIVRVLQSDLGVQVAKPLFAYVPMEEKVSVSTWMYDIESGLPVDDPVAYVAVDMMVDREMYMFLYMYGVSNDSANPNKPLTLDEFRAMGRTYNQTRKFGDACVSGRRKISSLDAYDVYDAIYHVVCRERALLASRAASLTTAMVSKQRIPDMSVGRIALLLPVCAVGAALVAPGKVFEYYLKRFTEMWKLYMAGKLKQAVARDIPSYVRLVDPSNMAASGYHADSDFEFERHKGINLLQLDQPVEVGQFEEVISGLASPTSEDAESFLDKGAFTDGASSTAVESEAPISRVRPLVLRRTSHDKPMTDAERRDVVFDNVSTVLTHDMFNNDYRVEQRSLMSDYADIVVSSQPVKFGTGVEQDVAKLHRHCRSSMVEFAVYSFDVGHGVVCTLRRQASAVVPGGVPDKRVIENMNSGQDLGIKVLNCANGTTQNAGSRYAIGVDPFTGKVHVLSTRQDGSVGIDALDVRFLVVSDAVKVFNSFAVARGVLKSLQRAYIPTFTMSLINGVPGCGKTSEIVRRFVMDDVVLCTVRHSKDDTLMRLLQSPKFSDNEEDLKLRVRTLDSVIMHGFRGCGFVSTVHVDEGMMAFPGQLYSALEKLRPLYVIVYGDEHQIKAIDRSPALGKLVYRGLDCWSSVEYRDTSYSMPADVCVLLAKHFYKRKIFTTSPVMRSLDVFSHKSVTDEPFVVAQSGWDYLSVLTADKGKLLTGLNFADGKKLQQAAIEDGTGVASATGGKSRVFTVHEAQGQRLSRTRIVRMNPNTSAVLNSKEHVVVAVSRHYYKCEYHTINMDDAIASLFREIPSEEQMREIMKEPGQEAIARIDRLSKGMDK